MAISNSRNGFPDGKWLDVKQSHYWLVYKRFGYFDDASGNEIIKLREAVRNAITEARTILDEHKVEIINVATQEYLDHRNYGNTIGIAIAFGSLEDKAMATILLDCPDDKYMI
jgi:hypothetical protein